MLAYESGMELVVACRNGKELIATIFPNESMATFNDAIGQFSDYRVRVSNFLFDPGILNLEQQGIRLQYENARGPVQIGRVEDYEYVVFNISHFISRVVEANKPVSEDEARAKKLFESALGNEMTKLEVPPSNAVILEASGVGGGPWTAEFDLNEEVVADIVKSCGTAPALPVATAAATPAAAPDVPADSGTIANIVATETTAEVQHRGPSFDCTKAATPVERMICSDDQLAEDDREMAAFYKANVATSRDDADQVAKLKAGQLAFLKRRDACNDVGCVSEAYRARHEEMGQMGYGWNTKGYQE